MGRCVSECLEDDGGSRIIRKEDEGAALRTAKRWSLHVSSAVQHVCSESR